MARVFRRQKLGAGSLRGAAQLSEKIELKSCVGSERQKVVLGLLEIFLAATEVAIAADLRKQAGTSDRNLSAGRIDAFGRKLQIIVLFERGTN